MLGCCLISGIELAVIMATTLERPDLFIAPISNHGCGAWVTTKEVFAHILAALGLKCLVVTIGGAVHQFKKRAITILSKQLVPFASPNYLHDVPTSASKDGFQLLDDLAVTANRTIKTLQVAVNNKGEIV